MRQQKLMAARRILFALTLTAMVAALTVTLCAWTSNGTVQGQGIQQNGIIDVLEQLRQAQAQQFEG